ncbi:unnamed protein product [Brassica oleracea var. botrytis]
METFFLSKPMYNFWRSLVILLTGKKLEKKKNQDDESE